MVNLSYPNLTQVVGQRPDGALIGGEAAAEVCAKGDKWKWGRGKKKKRISNFQAWEKFS